MTDAREFSQELVSAKYFANQDRDSDPEVDQPNGFAAPRHSAADQIMRRLTAFVIVMLLASAGGLCWLHRASIASSVNDLSKRRSAVDVMLWASGSKETFNSALSKRLDKAQADTEYQFQQTKPKFKSQFDGVDFSNLSDAWNGKRSSAGR
jgi:hypothetical protein